MEFVLLLVGLILGISAGSVITQVILKAKSVGTLRVDYTDPDGPYLFLILDESPDGLEHAKFVQMRVDKRT